MVPAFGSIGSILSRPVSRSRYSATAAQLAIVIAVFNVEPPIKFASLTPSIVSECVRFTSNAGVPELRVTKISYRSNISIAIR
jgi:hypothetical protein